MVKNSPANEVDIRDPGSIPESGRSPGGGNGNKITLARGCLKFCEDFAVNIALRKVSSRWFIFVIETYKKKTEKKLSNCK